MVPWSWYTDSSLEDVVGDVVYVWIGQSGDAMVEGPGHISQFGPANTTLYSQLRATGFRV